MIIELNPANKTQIKKMMPINSPAGIPLKTLTKKMNINPGPPLASSVLAVAIAGMMTKAASKAANVSKTATLRAELGRSSFLLKYEP